MHRRDRAFLWGAGAGAVAAIVCAVFAWLGVVNGDEGWYAVSARLVGDGRFPYKDFAFTQGPAYPYLLAPFLRLIPSLYTARALSVLCTAIAVGLLVTTARRVGGKWAAIASCAALLATIPSLPYWLSITKTYALCGLFFAAILFTLTSGIRPAVRFPLAAALAVGLTETRTTGLVVAILLIPALIVLSPDAKVRKRIVLAAGATALPFVILVLLDWTSAEWGLFEYHQLTSKRTPGMGRYVSRTFAVVHAWPGPFVLGVAALAVALIDSGMRARLKRRLDLVALAVGIVMFIVLHEVGAQFFSEEYLAPVIAIIVVVSSVVLVLVAAARRSGAGSRGSSIAVSGLLVAGIVFTAVTGGHNYYLGRPGWRGDPAALSSITRCVRRNSKPKDTIFALSLSEVVLEAHRRRVPGVSLGSFSYEDVSTKRARQLKILNSETLALTFVNRPPKLAVLTVDDIFETQRAGWFSHHKAKSTALYGVFSQYRPICTATLERHVFVNYPVHVTVYERPEAKP